MIDIMKPFVNILMEVNIYEYSIETKVIFIDHEN